VSGDPLHTLGQHGADYTAEQVEFGRECEREMRRLGVRTLTPGQIIAVAMRLGYRRA
jgi:hypothetical protein